MSFIQNLDWTGLSGSDLARHVAVFENVVDELMAQYEEGAQLLEEADAAASGGYPWMTVIILIAVAVVAIVVLPLARKMWVDHRTRQLLEEDGAESPLFDDQYVVGDDDIAITNAEAEPSLTAIADDGFAASDETVTVMAESDDGEEPVAAAEEVTIEAVGEETAVAYEDEPDTDEEEPADTAEEPEPAHEESRENVIPLMKRAEEASSQADDSDDRRHADAPLSEEAEETDFKVEQDEVRYAFASHQKGPMAFSSIAADDGDRDEPRHDKGRDTGHHDTGHDEDYRPRSYIAPTILREDFTRLERIQAERFDILRDEMTRQIASLKSDQNNRFDIVVDALDRKLAKLTEIRFEAPADGETSVAPILNEFTRQVNMLQSTLENQAQRIRAITQILDDRLGTMSHVYGEVRNIGDKIDRFNDRITDMEKAISDNSRLDMMADVQLSDVVRSSLPPDSYEFKPLLSNNHRADCVIRLPHPPGTIVVDTKFPLDAFNALPSREEVKHDRHQARGAEDSFRRAVLRHIIDVAERFIIPGETADSALMFVPTESIYTTLHSRFPDLIRDSFRARVWIVSPSTLMGTLQTLRGVLRDTRSMEENARKAKEEESLRAEMEDLRTRASTLARSFETTQSELRAILDATDKVFTRQPKRNGNGNGNGHRREHLVSELYDRTAEWPGSLSRHEEDKRSSSLYEEFSRRPDPLR